MQVFRCISICIFKPCSTINSLLICTSNVYSHAMFFFAVEKTQRLLFQNWADEDEVYVIQFNNEDFSDFCINVLTTIPNSRHGLKLYLLIGEKRWKECALKISEDSFHDVMKAYVNAPNLLDFPSIFFFSRGFTSPGKEAYPHICDKHSPLKESPKQSARRRHPVPRIQIEIQEYKNNVVRAAYSEMPLNVVSVGHPSPRWLL